MYDPLEIGQVLLELASPDLTFQNGRIRHNSESEFCPCHNGEKRSLSFFGLENSEGNSNSHSKYSL